MFGQTDPADDLDDPAWAYPLIYALGCAQTALWSSVGIQPSVVVGCGAGELAAARSAGTFSLENGLRLAVARGAWLAAREDSAKAGDAAAALDRVVESVRFEAPSLAQVRGATGRVTTPGEAVDPLYWGRRTDESVAPGRCAETLADRGVDVLLQIGPRGPSAVGAAWPDSGATEAGKEAASSPLVLRGLPTLAVNDEESDGSQFPVAVARAYEAGLPVAFAGLFAGEKRRRIALPGYPFERRRHWIEPPKR